MRKVDGAIPDNPKNHHGGSKNQNGTQGFSKEYIGIVSSSPDFAERPHAHEATWNAGDRKAEGQSHIRRSLAPVCPGTRYLSDGSVSQIRTDRDDGPYANN
jgi:hypothetical protein